MLINSESKKGGSDWTLHIASQNLKAERQAVTVSKPGEIGNTWANKIMFLETFMSICTEDEDSGALQKIKLIHLGKADDEVYASD